MITTQQSLKSGNIVTARVLTEPDKYSLIDEKGRSLKRLPRRETAEATCLYAEKPSAADKKETEAHLLAALEAGYKWAGGVKFTHKVKGE